MVAETDDREERTEESGEAQSSDDSALIGWLGAIHAEIRAARAESREESQAMRAEFREGQRETRRELSERIDRVDERVGGVDRRVARIEGGLEAERDKKNKTIMWLGIGVGALLAASLLN